MYNLIEKYMQNMKIDDVKSFAQKKGVNLSESELSFTYNFIKNNYQNILKNPHLLDLERYKNNYSPINYEKITKVFQEYSQKYSHYL